MGHGYDYLRPAAAKCPRCSAPGNQLKGKNFERLAVHISEDGDTIFGFTFSTGVELNFFILLDRNTPVIKAWPVIALPKGFVVDPRRDASAPARSRAVGGRKWDDPKADRAVIRRLRQE